MVKIISLEELQENGQDISSEDNQIVDGFVDYYPDSEYDTFKNQKLNRKQKKDRQFHLNRHLFSGARDKSKYKEIRNKAISKLSISQIREFYSDMFSVYKTDDDKIFTNGRNYFIETWKKVIKLAEIYLLMSIDENLVIKIAGDPDYGLDF